MRKHQRDAARERKDALVEACREFRRLKGWKRARKFPDFVAPVSILIAALLRLPGG